MKSTREHPSRRHVLRLVGLAGLAVLGAPVVVQLGRLVRARVKRLRAEDLPPVPWIGHC